MNVAVLSSANDSADGVTLVHERSNMYAHVDDEILYKLFPQEFETATGGWTCRHRDRFKCPKYSAKWVAAHLLKLATRQFSRNKEFICFVFDLLSRKVDPLCRLIE